MKYPLNKQVPTYLGSLYFVHGVLAVSWFFSHISNRFRMAGQIYQKESMYVYI